MTAIAKARIFNDVAEIVLSEAEYLAELFGKYASSAEPVGMTPEEKTAAMHCLFEKLAKAADDLHLCGQHARAQNILHNCRRDAEGDDALVQQIEAKTASLHRHYGRNFDA